MEKPIQISFTQKQENTLRNESKETGVSIAGLVRLAVQEYFTNKEGN